MYNELQAFLKRPPLYERTNAKFWNDPHIAGQMLVKHLDSTTDLASRKPEFVDRSVKWILSLPLPQKARLLDIGCGPGLYTKQFSEKGLTVTGMDFSESSIRYAKERDHKSKYILGDYLVMSFENAFDIITLIWCDYGALIPSERQNLLKRVYRALKPGGFFLLDVFTPQYITQSKETTSWELNPNGGFWSAKPYITLNATYNYDKTAVLTKFTVIEKSCVRDFNIWNCLFSKQSLLDEISAAGFSAEDFWNDVAGAPYHDNSQVLCVLMRKPLC